MAVTINYLYPVAGGVPPNPNEESNLIIATVTASAGTDTSAALTHFFALPASDISIGFPQIHIENEASQTIGAPFELSENPNFTVLGLQGIGSWKVFVDRVHSITR